MRTRDHRSSRNRKLEPTNAYLKRLNAEVRWLIASNGAWLLIRAVRRTG